MKHFIKGAAVTAAILIVLIVINVICNMSGHELDSTVTGVMAAICGMYIYDRLIKNEKNKDGQE